MEYTLNYQSEQLMDLLGIDEMMLDQNLFHFGTGSGWNDYAVSTSAELKYSGYSLNNYKMPLKTHLYNFTKDQNYTDNKLKVGSKRRYRTEEQRKQQAKKELRGNDSRKGCSATFLQEKPRWKC